MISRKIYNKATNGEYLASEKTIGVWSVSSGESIVTLYWHFDNIYSAAFSPNGEYLTSGSKDGSIVL